MAYEEALKLYQHAASLPHLEITGIDCHIGSQLLDPSPFAEALDKILNGDGFRCQNGLLKAFGLRPQCDGSWPVQGWKNLRETRTEQLDPKHEHCASG